MAAGTLLYAQSGGVTAVINATAAAVIAAARARRVKVLAARNGILGALREELIDTSAESAAAIRALAETPGGAFGSCRVKLESLAEDRARYERLMAVLRAHDVRWFLYNGGNDSADTALKVSQLPQRVRLSAHLHRRAEDHRQRPRRHRLLPRLRLGREIHRRLGPGVRARRGGDGRHLDQGLRLRGDGAQRRLARRRRRPRRPRRRTRRRT